MADESLSQEEINKLVKGQLEEGSGHEGRKPEVVPFDFKVPSSIPAEQTTTITLIHESFAQALTSSLSSFLHTDTFVTVEDVEQHLFSEYVRTLVNPTCVINFSMHPLTGYGVLEINSAVVYSIINRMLGGEGEVPAAVQLFTELELSVVRKLAHLILAELCSAWKYIINLDFAFQSVQTNPAFIRVIPTQEACIIVTLKLKISDLKGLVTICFPYVSLDPIANKLGTKQWSTYTLQQSEDVKHAVMNTFKQVVVDLRASLGSTEISFRDLLSLQPGDIINLHHKTKDPINLTIAGTEKFKTTPGLLGKFKAVSIQKEIVKE
ncbi:flagellar motor switch protein FliM [Simkania negevensis]|uniref:Flagellar motor switch protein FliM n=1 Tax=Simkania negevensis TaxID=83561 RepID=A0ABS3AQU6_9BACT|nr:flagellar motor switch protein FliM [Simkania negevensis]